MALLYSPISKLGPDLLLEIFDILAQDHHASLTSAGRCCWAWQPIAQSALYEDVVLDQQRLAKFVGRCADTRIRSLTVLMTAVPVDPYDPGKAKEVARVRIANLAQLCPRVTQMKPAALSISVDLPFPCTAAHEVARIVECLPTSCTSLEVKLSHGSCVSPSPAALSSSSHLCDSIRKVLPQLRHLRLCLPVLCPALFSSISSDGQGQNQHRQAVRAPLLRTCLVNLAQREPGPSTSGAGTTPCGEDTHRIPYVGQQQELPSALAPMVEVLKDFTSLNAGNLESLTVLDVQPHNPTLANSYAGWVRRDFLSNCSFPIPVWRVGIFSSSAHVARVPVVQKERTEARDWISKSRSQLDTMAEGATWIQTSSGARLPVQMMLRRHRLPDAALTRAQYQQGNKTSCMLWANEDKTGQHLLPTGPGELLRGWELREIIPDGLAFSGLTSGRCN
ncbi:hypothetical protein BJ166DRAFT_513584 [Pestalotiopsis sp. NC0098]|nr:hypothetical protein BJ166DRAFT_513584 [Pestalotiopsis sp. NC0098]